MSQERKQKSSKNLWHEEIKEFKWRLEIVKHVATSQWSGLFEGLATTLHLWRRKIELLKSGARSCDFWQVGESQMLLMCRLPQQIVEYCWQVSYFKRCQANGVNMTPPKQRVNFIYSTTDSWPRYNPVSPVVRLYAHRFVCIIVCTHTTKFIVRGVHYVVRMHPQPNCATWWSSKAKATVRETQHHMSAEWECRYARI